MKMDTDMHKADILHEAIASRRSLGLKRIHPERPVERALVERVLEVADWAPSHGETEPWRFTVYTGDARHTLGEAWGEAYRQSAGDRFSDKAFEASRAQALAAPAWISIGMEPALKEDGSPLMRPEEELIAVGCAVQNLHLMANALGLAGMWLSGVVFVHPHTARFVGLEPPARLLGFFFLGWPAIQWPEGQRRPLHHKVRWAEEEYGTSLRPTSL